MKPCDRYQERLWLDAHGELPPEGRIELTGHLAICPGCRQEERALHHLVRKAAAAGRPPALTAAESGRLTANVLRALEAGQARKPWRLPSFRAPMPAWFRTAAAFGMIAAVVAGVGVGFRAFRGADDPIRTAAVPSQEERILIENLEIIENLDLLEELDDLEKLVRVADMPVKGETPPDRSRPTDKDRVSGEREGHHAA